MEVASKDSGSSGQGTGSRVGGKGSWGSMGAAQKEVQGAVSAEVNRCKGPAVGSNVVSLGWQGF